jgi:hypothetical protein
LLAHFDGLCREKFDLGLQGLAFISCLSVVAIEEFQEGCVTLLLRLQQHPAQSSVKFLRAVGGQLGEMPLFAVYLISKSASRVHFEQGAEGLE